MHRIIAAISVLTVSCGAAGQSTPTWMPIDDVNLYSVQGMIVHDEDGPGPIEPYLVAAGGDDDVLTQIYPPGRARSVRLPVNGVGKFDGFSWRAMGAGLYGTSRTVLQSATGFVSGPDPRTGRIGLFGTGQFTHTGSQRIYPLVTYTSDAWEGVGGTYGAAHEIGLYDIDGPGPIGSTLILSSVNIAPQPNPVYVECPAVWDGRRWSVLGGGVFYGPPRPGTRTYVTWDEDGEGPSRPTLFIGGSFDRAGTHWAESVCRWDGVDYTALGGGPGVSAGPHGFVRALEVYDDDGPGPNPSQLYALGSYSTVYDHGNALSIKDLARWDGKQWSAVPGWDQLGNAYDMAVFDDDGPGPNREALYIAGWNPKGGGKTGSGIIKWDGVDWHTLGNGVWFIGFPFAEAQELCVFDDDGPGPNPGGLYVGGAFNVAGDEWANGFARWGIPLPEPCFADCDRAGPGYRVLDIFDFLCFQTRFAAGDPYACDADTSTGPRVCDLFDFLYFQNAFAAGCP